MKRFFLLQIFLLGFIKAYSISGGYDYYIFYTPEGKPYVEVYYWVEGKTIHYKNISDFKKQGELEVTILISHQDTSKVFSYEKIKLSTMEFDIGDSLLGDVYDVKRIMVPAGISYLELSVKDINATTNDHFSSWDTLNTLDPATSDLFVSNIQLIDFVVPTQTENRFSKGGYDILPYHGNYYASDQGKLMFYAEIINANKTLNEGGKYLMNCYLENSITGIQLENFLVRKRMKAEKFTVVLSEFSIVGLGPGSYNFVVEVRDSLNSLKTKNSIPIIRENLYVAITEDAFKTINIDKTWADYLPKDSLAEYVHSLRPICEGNEYQFVKNILKENDPNTMRRFLYAFWTNRYPDEPAFPYKSYSEFKSYNNLVYYVNQSYSTKINKGYLTERGRVFLRYGAPNSISSRYFEPSTYPYEIWYYYKLNAQAQVKFVFYTDDLSGGDFRLLHSDLRGEIQNRQWDRMLYPSNSPNNGDQNNMGNTFGGWAGSLFSNPR